ncbi:MAG TPA: prolipoprotein diacylglyceryl transferase family protein [Acidobacteriota bacterium]|nr:prolipoprotein diacylglyceryl transferase family protein [Acidobacteriota bacterium]
MFPRQILNALLDDLARPHIRMLGKRRSSFHICGVTGLTLFVVEGVLLTAYRSLSLEVWAVLALLAVAVFLALPMIGKILTGEERLTSLHHKGSVLAAAASLLWLLGQPVLAYLDMLILSVGLFVACGRVGCLMVGCCHGRPHHWGVCYRQEHAAAGFTPYFVGVRLVPVQIVESLWVFAIVTVGNIVVLNGGAPGQALAWYALSYCAGRFLFEFLRGDAARPFYGGFSQPQWSCLVVLALVGLAGPAGFLPFQPWHPLPAAGVAAAMGAVSLRRRFSGNDRHLLLHPRHIREIATILKKIDKESSPKPDASAPSCNSLAVDVGCSSLGIQISGGEVGEKGRRMQHYALSQKGGALEAPKGRMLAELILLLKHHRGPSEFVKGGRDVFHLMLPIPTARNR